MNTDSASPAYHVGILANVTQKPSVATAAIQKTRCGQLMPRVRLPVVPIFRKLSEIDYLWREPHRIGGGKLRAAVGNIPLIPFRHGGAGSACAIGHAPLKAAQRVRCFSIS